MPVIHIRVLSLKITDASFPQKHLHIAVGTLPRGKALGTSVKISTKKPLAAIFSCRPKPSKDEKLWIGITLRKETVGSVILPFSWFRPGYVVREWFPLHTDKGWNGPLMLLDIHYGEKDDVPFEAPFSSMIVTPAWNRPPVVYQQQPPNPVESRKDNYVPPVAPNQYQQPQYMMPPPYYYQPYMYYPCQYPYPMPQQPNGMQPNMPQPPSPQYPSVGINTLPYPGSANYPSVGISTLPMNPNNSKVSPTPPPVPPPKPNTSKPQHQHVSFPPSVDTDSIPPVSTGGHPTGGLPPASVPMYPTVI